uniref:ShKT domain-containing protein n=1 Tax=Meloidogyne incognita TaxID=6306 RepID=A0A914LB59_MELIC
MKLNFKIFLLFLIKLLLQVKAIEYKLREAKPHKHRCAYQYKNENNEEEGKWILKPSAKACPNELDIVWPEEQTNNLLLIGESTHDNKQNKKGRKRKREEETQQQQTLCQIIFGKKEGEEQRLRSEACDNEWIQPLARKCRKECGTCCELPEFQCEDKAHSENHRDKYQLKQHSFSCYTIKNIQNKCQKTSVWYPTLSEHCQSTCGLCELERKKIEENRRREESWDDNDVSMEKKKKNKMKIPRSKECRNRHGDIYCLKKVLTKGNACRNKPWILDRCQEACGVCLPWKYKCRNKENYNRRCKRWNHNDFCLKTKFSLAIKLHYCAEECMLCDREDDIEEEDYEDDEDVMERGKQKWLV